MSFMDSKSSLARILAGEGLNVEQGDVETAMFNVKERTLLLPNWNGLSEQAVDYLIAHEVGHAIYTPKEFDIKELVQKHITTDEDLLGAAASCLNIVEDVRIERKIKARYPGCRKDFLVGSRELWDAGKFHYRSMEQMNKEAFFVDRLNTRAKLGDDATVKSGMDFSEKEEEFFQRCMKAETFTEVLKLAKELFEQYQQERKDNPDKVEQQKREMKEMQKKAAAAKKAEGNAPGKKADKLGQSVEIDDSDLDDASDDGSDSGDQDGEEGEEDGKAFIPLGGRSTTTDGYVGGAMTEVAISHVNKNRNKATVKAIEIPRVNLKNAIRSWQQVNEQIKSYVRNNGQLREFERKNMPSINQMIMEFQQKKAANIHVHQSHKDSGSIDMKKLHSYRYNDEIFRSTVRKPVGKNHAFFFVIDWSGSMSCRIDDTIKQVVMMTMFLKKLSIPFEVFSFGNCDSADGRIFSNRINDNGILRNLLSSEMSKQTYEQHASYLLNYKNRHAQQDGMGGTPLDPSILIIAEHAAQYKASKSIDVMNIVYLTDGENGVDDLFEGRSSRAVIRDRTTNRTYSAEPTTSGHTAACLNYMKDRVGANVIGFFIADSENPRNFIRRELFTGPQAEKNRLETLKKQRYALAKSYGGYDRYFVVPSDLLDLHAGQKEISQVNDTSKISTVLKSNAEETRLRRLMTSELVASVVGNMLVEC